MVKKGFKCRELKVKITLTFQLILVKTFRHLFVYCFLLCFLLLPIPLLIFKEIYILYDLK